jgi:hypothetical protein
MHVFSSPRADGAGTNSPRLFTPGETKAIANDEPDSSRLAAPDWRIWSQLQIQFQSGAGTTSL